MQNVLYKVQNLLIEGLTFSLTRKPVFANLASTRLQPQEEKMHTLFGVLGASVVVFVSVRVGATAVDIYQRWRDNDWDV